MDDFSFINDNRTIIVLNRLGYTYDEAKAILDWINYEIIPEEPKLRKACGIKEA